MSIEGANMTEMERLIRKAAGEQGISVIGSNYGGVLMAMPTVDGYEARFTVTFETMLVTGQQAPRPLARDTFGHAEISDASDARLMAMAYTAVSRAKATLIKQLRATLDRLESLP